MSAGPSDDRPARRDALLITVARLDRTTVFLATLALGTLGLFLPRWYGALLIYGVVAALAALLRLTWPLMAPPVRMLRLLVLAILAVVATLKIVYV
jgi:hypothetical protein